MNTPMWPGNKTRPKTHLGTAFPVVKMSDVWMMCLVPLGSCLDPSGWVGGCVGVQKATFSDTDMIVEIKTPDLN